MKFIDHSASVRISQLLELMQALKLCRTPYEAILRYCGFLKSAYPGRSHLVLSTIGLGADEYRVWRFLGDDGVEHVPLCDPWGRLDLPIYHGGVIARVIEANRPQLVHEINWSGDPYFSQLMGPYRSMIAVPLLDDQFPVTWSIMLSRNPTKYSAVDLEESVSRAALFGSLIHSLHVTRQLAAAHAQIDHELERMARIQRGLLPEPIPQIQGLQLAASYETFTQVGGDLYDFIPVGDGKRWCFFIGDASGHGPSAAVAAAMTQATLHACRNTHGPAELFQTLNRHLYQNRIEGSFVTAFLGFYEPADRRLTFVSAGHPAPLIPARKDRTARFLEGAGGLPLGIEQSAEYQEDSVSLEPGDTLLLFTDGIPESRNLSGAMFGVEGIEQSLRETVGAGGVIARLRQSLGAHQQGTSPRDDQTAVAIHVEK